MKIVKNSNNNYWLCSATTIVCLSYSEVIAYQDIANRILYVIDSTLSNTSNKHLKRIKDTCTGYQIKRMPYIFLSSNAFNALNRKDDDPYSTNDNMVYKVVNILSTDQALEYYARHYTGNIKNDTIYQITDDYFILRSQGLWIGLNSI